jgi:hypothetical protein
LTVGRWPLLPPSISLSVDHEASSEFWLRTEVGGVAQARGFQVGFSALGDGAWIAVIALAVRRFNHVALHEQGGFFHERIDVRGVWIRQQNHVGCFNTLPAGDRGTVKRVTRFELVDVKVRHWHGNVLFFTTGISETEINEFHFVFLDHFQNFCGCHCHAYLLKGMCGTRDALLSSIYASPKRLSIC